MDIDLNRLNYENSIVIDDNINIPEKLFLNTDIVSLPILKVKGSIKYDYDGNYAISLNVDGEMMLHDSLNYDLVPYDFHVDILENLENSIKHLDLTSFLWHYIVLEIPLRYTTCDTIEKISGKDYRVISEDECVEANNPFKDFFKD